MQKTLDQKLKRIAADSNCGDFILADAKDADMGLGIAAPGPNYGADAARRPTRSLAEFRDSIRQIVAQGLVDIMLVSPSTNEMLTLRERLFDHSPVTPAVRANDTTDIWCGLSGSYSRQPSLPFRSTSLAQIQSGHQGKVTNAEAVPGADLGLYSITFNNDARLDRESLEAYREFRETAARNGFRHFLEVFEPNQTGAWPVRDIPAFVNDCIVRTLAGVVSRERPIFLKIPYFGPAALEALVHYDPTLIVGILGGSAGTTLDAFQLLADARRYGARAALFGRKINSAEDPLAFIEALRRIADGDLQPREAVQIYHAELQRKSIPARRSLADDLQLTR